MDLRRDGANDDICNSSTIHEVIKDGKQLWTGIRFINGFRFFLTKELIPVCQ